MYYLSTVTKYFYTVTYTHWHAASGRERPENISVYFSINDCHIEGKKKIILYKDGCGIDGVEGK